MQLMILLKRNEKKWKPRRLEGSKDEYKLAKKAARRTVYDVKQEAQSKYFQDINTNNDRNKIFKMARAIKDTNKDVTGEKCVCDNKGNLAISDKAVTCLDGTLSETLKC